MGRRRKINKLVVVSIRLDPDLYLSLKKRKVNISKLVRKSLKKTYKI